MNSPLRRTKILATLGPATDQPGVIDALLQAGVNAVRLNFSHGTPVQHAERLAAMRAAASRRGFEIGVLADLPGPKIRIEKFAEGKVRLRAGQPFALVCRTDTPPGDERQVGCSYLGLPQDVVAGDTLLLDDGLIALLVDRIEGEVVHAIVQNDGVLSNRKGLNRLGGGLNLGALTDEDRGHILTAAKLGVDFIAVSFCRHAADIELARELARAAGSKAQIVAKIERAEAIERLGEIIDAADVVMVARGDLGVEIGYAELPGLQKSIISESLARKRVVITATQMLQSMVDSTIPTRAEVLDVANAVIDGTDAVMLSAETASGQYPVKAVEAMAKICLAAERQFRHDTDFEAASRGLARADEAIARAAMFLAEHIDLKAIVALTESGDTARHLSRYRAPSPVYALSRFDESRRRMSLMRDVHPIHFDSRGLSPGMAAQGAARQLHGLGHLAVGDRVIVTNGDSMERQGSTNTLRLLEIGADGMVVGVGEL